MSLLSLLLSVALASPCPTPTPGAGDVAADGAAHLLAASDDQTCWWIVDDLDEPRLGGRWDRHRRDPVALAALADGRAVVVLREDEEGEARWRVGVRTEAGSQRLLRVTLPGPPGQMRALADTSVVLFGWTGTPETWLLDVDTEALVRVFPDEAVTPAGRSDAR